MASLPSFPYEAVASKRYKSPHKNDLSFAKGDRIRVVSLAPKDEDEEEEDDDDEPDQWLVGETLDGTKTGTFPASHVQAAPREEPETAVAESHLSEPAATAAVSDPIEVQSSKAVDEAPAAPETEPVLSEAKVEAPSIQQTSETIPDNTPLPTPQQEEAPIAAPGKTQEEPPAAKPVPERKPSSPPLAPKPSGLAARIAAFNKPQDAAPPPLPKGKPGAWKRPAPAPGAPKPVLPGASPAQQAKVAASSSTVSQTDLPKSPPTTTVDLPGSESQSQSNAGFSAADAQSSIKMSLKERMAALQRGDDRSSTESPTSRPSAPPKAAPGKIAEERRNVALAGMGVGATNTSAAPQSVDPQVTEDGDFAAETGEEIGPLPTTPTEVGSKEIPATGDGETVDAGDKGEQGQGGESTEEELESERRAAIAKRMAALGGRRMGGGPALFGAPAPPVRQTSNDAQTTPQVKTEEAPIEAPVSLAVEEKEGEHEPTQTGKTLAVPRRAAPPRKKKSSASSNPATEAAAPEETDQQDTTAPNQSRLGEKAAEVVGVGAVGTAAGAMIVEGTKDLTEEPSSTKVDEEHHELAPSDVTSEFEPSTPISEGQMDENAKRLEEFIRTPGDEKSFKMGAQSEAGDVESVQEEEDANDVNPATDIPSVSSPPPPTSVPPPRPESVIGRPPSTRPPSTRPPSTRPPIPKSSVTSEDIDRLSSPAPTRAPPVPVPGRRDSQIRPSKSELEIDNDGEQTVEPAAQTEAVQPTIIARPKPRMAVPVEASDDEREEEEEKGDADQRGASTTTTSEVQPVPATIEPEGLTEEEEDGQRRARIAARMAKMGGQPIMGAPMPFRKQTVPVPAAAPEVDTETEAAEPEEERGKEETEAATPKAPVRMPSIRSPPPSLNAASPPPAPTSPPPIPTKSPPPAGGSALEKRMSQVSASNDNSLARRASMMSRPPVPSVTHSREVSSVQPDDEEVEEGDEEEDAPNSIATLPPTLPSSPPPRAPPRAAPRQPSTVEDEVMTPPVVDAATVEAPPRMSLQQQQQPPAPRSARDLDLMPSSQWWRHGMPVKLPPTLLRPDANPVISRQDIGNRHLIRVELIFEDYSSTVVEVHYEDDDAKEEATRLIQQHNFAPPRPTSEQLHSWSQRYGALVAKQAVASLSSKAVYGDGSSKGYISALMASAVDKNLLLPPVGSSFGSIVLAQAATTPVDVGADEIRTGDIIALHGVDFKGKRGLASYQATFGSANDPTYACIIESEAKKRKLRCILVPGTEGKKGKAPEEVSLRLDDVKSGLLRVFRLAPRDWLAL